MDICKLCGEYKLDTLPCDCQAASVSDSPELTGYMTRIDALAEAIDALHWHAEAGNDRAEEAMGVVSKMRIQLLKQSAKRQVKTGT